jgi:hypothetical protein
MLRLDQCGFHKNCARTSYVEHMFLHPVGFAGHVVYSGASRAQNGDALFFMLWWNQFRLDKKRGGIYYAELVFLHRMGSMGHVVHSSPSRE